MQKNPLFDNITAMEIADMQKCSFMRKRIFNKDELIFRMGDITHELGMVLEGSIIIENNDLWGNTSILGRLGKEEIFAETYALSGRPMLVEVIAAEKCRILFLDLASVMAGSYAGQSWYGKMLRNLLTITSTKNLLLSSRIFCTASKSIRGRVLAYLSEQAVRTCSSVLLLPFNRQQLADYLNVDRSALSKELGKMKKEGLLDYRKNKFTLLSSLLGGKAFEKTEN